jgi:wobble nucleotide-excising tRNase
MDGIACFKAATKLETDKKVNLVYGLNGTGKSTISNFLYDPSNSDYSSCRADISGDEKVLVYNQQFIRDYFYEADSLKGIFSLSKENKEIEQKIKTAEVDLAALTDTLSKHDEDLATLEQSRKTEKAVASETTWEIRRQYSGGDRVLEYCLAGLMGKKEALFDYIRKVPKPESKPDRDIPEIKKDVESLVGDSAQTYEPIPLIDFQQGGIERDELLALVIVGNQDSAIANLVTALNNSDWVREGLKYMPSPEDGSAERCPFCQEPTITKSIAESIESYFDESFEDSVRSISRLLNRYEEAATRILTAEMFSAHPLASSKILEFTKKHQALSKLIARNLTKLEKKKDTPSAKVTLEESSTAVSELNEIIQSLNREVEIHNQRIANTEQELAKLKEEFWQVLRWEFDQTISRWTQFDGDVAKKIEAAKTERVASSNDVVEKRAEISDLQRSTVSIEGAIENINLTLQQLGITDFFIAKYTNSLYRIVRNNDQAAKFASLSEGEKMLISFLYFVEICRGKESVDEAVSRKIVVIDDPISSLSHIYVFNIGQLLKIEFFNSELFEQVFVLTHSLYFFYELTDANHERRKNTQRLFRLVKNDEGSSLHPMKYEEIQNDYQSYWVIVADRKQPPALIANCMRNIVEYFFNFVQKADLSNVVQKPELQENRFQAFCRYISRESHSFGQNIFDFKEFDYDDFRAGLQLIFEVTGYPEHYKKMINMFST